MDALLINTTTVGSSDGFPKWDFNVTNGVVPIIYNTREQEQQAAISAFAILNGVPQLTGIGVDWLGAMTGNTTFGTIDSQITNAISNNGLNYRQQYTIVNGQLKVTIVKGQQN